MDDRDGDVAEEERERYRELLEELRTVIPGVQVLFAFLLTVPFATRFSELDDLGVQVFAVALITVALATVVLMTPAAYHRLTPRHDRRQRIRLGVRVVVAGMSLLSVAVGSSVFVVGRFIFATNGVPPGDRISPSTIGAAMAGVVAATAVFLWFALPVARRNRR